MFSTLIIQLVLTLIVLLVVVPKATDNGVAVREGGFFRGLLTLVGVSILNRVLWMGFALFTLGGAVIANLLLFGLIGLGIHALAFKVFSWLFPDVLQVRSFGSACWASLIMMVAGYLISHVSLI